MLDRGPAPDSGLRGPAGDSEEPSLHVLSLCTLSCSPYASFGHPGSRFLFVLQAQRNCCKARATSISCSSGGWKSGSGVSPGPDAT